ncbi:hypothetical protein AGDE_01897 [Angomonas deanei]|nr:hypothetical protein AGDE_01897 [Angomonas deanei]|eukprot:EPY42026.1 hypothetical protein AGDE_01897 [Angomonas deanei]
MFRRTVRRLQSSKNFHQSDRERGRMNDARRRETIYDAQGNLIFSGLLKTMWEDYKTPFLCIVGFFSFTFVYNRLIVHLNQGERRRVVAMDKASEEQQRRTGKLQADRYLVKPTRQTDDPDFLNIPSFAGKGVYKSALFTDDALSTSETVSEVRRA